MGDERPPTTEPHTPRMSEAEVATIEAWHERAYQELRDRTVEDRAGLTCERTRTAAERHDTVVTLLPDPIAEDHVACIRAGATAVADANGEPRTIAAVLDAVATDQVLIPATTFQRLVAIARSASDEVKVAQAEIDWLRQLAAGDHVSELAEAGNWSVRAMHRALTALYRRIGVANRDQAVAWAARSTTAGLTITAPLAQRHGLSWTGSAPLAPRPRPRPSHELRDSSVQADGGASPPDGQRSGPSGSDQGLARSGPTASRPPSADTSAPSRRRCAGVD